jgi:hypothetical protein
MPVGIYSVFGRGDHSIPPDRVFYVLISVMFMFLCSHWEKYNTGVLYLPWGYDVSQLVSSKAQLPLTIRCYNVNVHDSLVNKTIFEKGCSGHVSTVYLTHT